MNARVSSYVFVLCFAVRVADGQTYLVEGSCQTDDLFLLQTKKELQGRAPEEPTQSSKNAKETAEEYIRQLPLSMMFVVDRPASGAGSTTGIAMIACASAICVVIVACVCAQCISHQGKKAPTTEEVRQQPYQPEMNTERSVQPTMRSQQSWPDALPGPPPQPYRQRQDWQERQQRQQRQQREGAVCC